MTENYLDEFKNPSSSFRGAPFWAWNCKLNKETLIKQIDYFRDMGMGGFTIHSRTGMETPYLGKEYMELVKACVEKAKALDMKAYLYDEDRWPSGFGGGEVTKDISYRSRYLVFTPIRSEDRKTVDICYDNTAYPYVTGEGKLIARYDITLKDGYLTDYHRLNDGEDGKNIWYAYLEVSPESPLYNNQTYVNVLDKKAIERFIETTHEKYYEAMGDEFGGTIPSIFTDEPHFIRKTNLVHAYDKSDVFIPYTDDFEASFQDQYQDSFLDHLPEVCWELPDKRVSVTRYRYHDHLTERFTCAFSDTLGNWCKKHNIQLTGHMKEEVSLESQTHFLGEAMRLYRGFQVPGIDILCNIREYSTAKQAQSAAHQMGANEVTSELYGVTNWDFDFRGHKLQGDWQAALGVTHRTHHLSWVTMAGGAKRDYPASIFYQSPWYLKYNELESYFARINTALRSGKPKVKVGVIHPIESYWLYCGTEEQTAIIRSKLQQQFEQIIDWLLFGLIDFDFISESLMTTLPQKHSGKGFQVGDMCYDVIIVPGCKTLRNTTMERLNAFVEASGEVIFMGDIPTYVDAIPSGEPMSLAACSTCIDFDYGKLMESLKSYRVIDIHTQKGLRSDRYLYQMREDGENLVVFIANGKVPSNSDVPKPEVYNATIYGIYQITIMDPMSGETFPYPVSYSNGTTVLTYKLYEHDSLLLYLSKPTDKKIEFAKNNSDQLVQILNKVSSYTTSEPNVLMLDQAEYSIDQEAFQPMEEVLRIDNILRIQLNYPQKMDALVQPWIKSEVESICHTLTLRYTFHSDISIEKAKLAMEYPEIAAITLNDVPVDIVIDGYFVDECIKTFSLPTIYQGINELAITIPYSKDTNLEWCYILGDFGVQVYGNRSRIVHKAREIGFSDLTSQTFPFFGGNMTYCCDVDVDEGDYVLEVTKFRSPLISVKADGTEAGSILISPYRINLGHLCGKHRIQITAFGSRINTFGTVHNCDDTTWWFGPDAWRTEGSRYSYEYQLKKTGILAAPKLYKIIEEP